MTDYKKTFLINGNLILGHMTDEEQMDLKKDSQV